MSATNSLPQIPTEHGTLRTTCGQCQHVTTATLAGGTCYGSDADFCAGCGRAFGNSDKVECFVEGSWQACFWDNETGGFVFEATVMTADRTQRDPTDYPPTYRSAEPTPGPWHASRMSKSLLARKYQWVVVDSDYEYVIAEAMQFGEEDLREANVKIMAAAPTLLAALRMIADGQDDPAWMRVKAREAIASVKHQPEPPCEVGL